MGVLEVVSAVCIKCSLGVAQVLDGLCLGRRACCNDAVGWKKSEVSDCVSSGMGCFWRRGVLDLVRLQEIAWLGELSCVG